jgi:NADP-dependent 3-hydroxy acid dehydrogenase YdfG
VRGRILVVAVGRSAERLAALEAEFGLGIEPASCDVTDEAQIADLAVRPPTVRIVVDNAGDSAAAPIGSETLGGWQRILEVDATSALMVTRAFSPGMVAVG